MPIQSKQISLSALGIDDVRGMVRGNHLRIGFNPLKGFPSCGFELFRRRHMKGPAHTVDWTQLFLQQNPALFRWGYRQEGINIFHAANSRPQESSAGGIRMTSQTLQLSFRATPFSPDSNPKICEVKLRVRSRGTLIAEAFDDRHDGQQFTERLVVRERRIGGFAIAPGFFDRVLMRLYSGWSWLRDSIFHALLPDRLAKPNLVSESFIDRETIDKIKRRFDSAEEIINSDILKERLGSSKNEEKPPVPVSPWRRSLARVLVAFDSSIISPLFRGSLLRWEAEHEVVLNADLISLVKIKAPAGSRVISIEYKEVSDLAWSKMSFPTEAAWGQTKEIPILLPTAEDISANKSKYPTCPSLIFNEKAKDIESDLPISRLQDGFVSLTDADDIHAEYPDLATMLKVYLGPNPERARFVELSATLDQLQKSPPNQQHQTILNFDSGDPEESISFAPLPLILAGSIDINFARMIGLALIDKQVNNDDHLDYKVVAKWNDVDHAWITHDIFLGRDGELAEPAPLTTNPVVDYTRPDEVKTNMELDWQAPGVIERLNRARQYAGYHIFRRPSANGNSVTRLTEKLDDLVKINTPELLLLAETQGEEPLPPGPTDTGHYIDRPAIYSTFDYGSQAVDLFGRRSNIVWVNDVDVPVLVDPPPVSELYGYYLDTNDPDIAELLEEPAQRILNATGQTGFSGRALLIEFRYPKASIDAIVGDIAFFELAFRQGRPNKIPVLIESATIVGPAPELATSQVLADVEMLTAIPINFAIDDFGGDRARGTLASVSEHFVIESATVLSSQRLRLRVKARRDYLPQLVQSSLSFGAGNAQVNAHMQYRNPRDPDSWSGFDLRLPKGDDDQGGLSLSGVDNSIIAPFPVDIGGDQIIVSRSVEPPTTHTEEDTGPAVDWVYRIVIKNLDIPLPPGFGDYFSALTVQVVSGAGRRGELPAPAHVRRRLHEPPQAVTNLASDDFLLATRPDFNGRIDVQLIWPKTPGINEYKIYRVEVQRLLKDLGEDPSLADDLLISGDNRSALTLLGGRLASIDTYTLVTPKPVHPQADPQQTDKRRWVDNFPSPREGAYLYRVQPINAQGVDAEWPADSLTDNDNRARCVLVLQRNRDLLMEPSIYALEPLDRSVGVIVRKPLSESITGLRIYKTDKAKLANDVRKMTLIHGTIPFIHERIEEISSDGNPTRLRFVDGKVTVGIEYFYRIKWVDSFGNESTASPPMAVSPDALLPPEAPTLDSVRVDETTVQLSWQANHSEGQVRLQRKYSGASQWIDVLEDVNDQWYAPTDAATDAEAAGFIAHRLLLRDAKGRLVYSSIIITGE